MVIFVNYFLLFGFFSLFGAQLYQYDQVYYPYADVNPVVQRGLIFFLILGEIEFRLKQDWDPESFLNPTSAAYKILEGNVKRAVKLFLI